MSIELGDMDTAQERGNELEEIAGLARSDFYRAQAQHACGAYVLAGGSTSDEQFRASVRTFLELGLPYEAARARSDLALAHREDGGDTLAQMELRAALAAFEKLGSEADVSRVQARIT